MHEGTLLRRAEGQVSTSLSGETAVLQVAKGRFYGLEGTAEHVWDLLTQPRTLGEIVDALTDRFDVTPDQCRDDLVPFLEALDEAGLLDVGASPPGGRPTA